MPRKRPEIADKPTKRQTAKCRAAIQTTQLINRLHKVAMGEVEASQTQVRAALGLLSKTLPDLSATQVEDVTPERTKSPLEVKAQLDALMQENFIDALTRAGIDPDTASRIASGELQLVDTLSVN